MAASFVSTSTVPTSNLSPSLLNLQYKQLFPSFSLPNSIPRLLKHRLFCCFAAKQQSGPVKKCPPPTSSANKKRKKNSNNKNRDSDDSGVKGFSVLDDLVDGDDDDDDDDDGGGGGGGETTAKSTRKKKTAESGYQALPLPKPPAGFVVDDQGRILMVSDKRIVTIVDSTNNFPLECTIRRVFRSSRGDECMLLCPVDTPVQIMKSTNFDGWSAVSDEEVEAILPTASYALAKIHMHLVYSGFCYTARGGFCYTEDDIFECRSDDGQDLDGLPTEGVEITCFHLDGSHYMIYTPSDPLLFVAVKDQNGQLQIADDELLEDPATISTIDEETEFNALVEEEAALLESLMGER